VIKVNHTNATVNGGNAKERYLAYSNVANKPEIKAYDKCFSSQVRMLQLVPMVRQIQLKHLPLMLMVI